MKSTAWLALLSLLVMAMVVFVLLRVDPTRSPELEPDGELYVGSRRVAVDEASYRRFFARHRWRDPLLVRPETDAVHLFRALRAAHAAGVTRATVRSGELEESVALPKWPLHLGSLRELDLSLRREGDRLTLRIGNLHAETVELGDAERRLRELEPRLREIAGGILAWPGDNVGVVRVGPGVPAELALKACRTLRLCGGGESQLAMPGESHGIEMERPRPLK